MCCRCPRLRRPPHRRAAWRLPPMRHSRARFSRSCVECHRSRRDRERRTHATFAAPVIAAGFLKRRRSRPRPGARTHSGYALWGHNSRPRASADGAHRRRARAARDWSVDPSALERDGWLRLRARTIQARGPMLVPNFIRLKREGSQPARDLRGGADRDEETSAEGH